MGKILIIVAALILNISVIKNARAVDSVYDEHGAGADNKTTLTPELMQELLQQYGTTQKPQETYIEVNGKFYTEQEFAIIKAHLEAQGKIKENTSLKKFIEMFLTELGMTAESISEFLQQREERGMRSLEEKAQDSNMNMMDYGANNRPVYIEGVNPKVQGLLPSKQVIKNH